MKKTRKTNRLKIIACYEIIISSLVIILSIYSIFRFPELFQFFNLSGFVVSIMGLVGGILLLKNVKIGLRLSIFWAIIQTFKVNIGKFYLDFSQLLQLNFALDLRPEINALISINFLGILLAILLIKWGKDLFKK